MIPFKITFKNLPESDEIWMDIQDRIEKLERLFPRLLRCEVVITAPHRRRHSDGVFHLQILVSLPGQDVIISRDPERNETHRNVYLAIRDAFNAAERKLQDQVRRMRQNVKFHEDSHRAKIARIFSDEGYGFIESEDGREVYFHANSLINENFEALEVGQPVRFNEEAGEQGPQVTSMSPISGRRGAR